MTSFISRIHADLRNTRITRRNAHEHPDTASRTQKSYPRMERIPLQETASITAQTSGCMLDACGALLARATAKRSELLDAASEQIPPFEIYIISSAPGLGAFAATAYHYERSAHVLEKLWEFPLEAGVDDFYRSKDLGIDTFFVCTGIWERLGVKNGDFSYILTLLEVGRLTERFITLSAALKLRAFEIPEFDDQALTQALDLDPGREQPIQVIGIVPSNFNERRTTV